MQCARRVPWQRRARSTYALAFTYMCAVAPNAQASDVTSANSALADTLFREGRREFKAGHIDAACKLFIDSLKLDRTAGTAINVGQCEEKRGRLARALFAFRDAHESLQPSDERYGYVNERIAALSASVAHLTIQRAALAAGQGQQSVLLDGEPLPDAAFGVPLPVDAGTHVLTASAEDYKATRVEHTLSNGDAHTLTVSVGSRIDALAPHAATGPLPTPPPAPRSTAWSYGLGATSGVLLIGGTISGISLLSAASTFRERCDTGTRVCLDAEGDSARARANTLQWVTPALLGAGVAAGVAAVLVWPKTENQSTNNAALWFLPALGPSGAEAQLGGRF